MLLAAPRRNVSRLLATRAKPQNWATLSRQDTALNLTPPPPPQMPSECKTPRSNPTVLQCALHKSPTDVGGGLHGCGRLEV